MGVNLTVVERVCVNICRSDVMQAVAISSKGNVKFPVLLRCAATAQFRILKRRGLRFLSQQEISYESLYIQEQD